MESPSKNKKNILIQYKNIILALLYSCAVSSWLLLLLFESHSTRKPFFKIFRRPSTYRPSRLIKQRSATRQQFRHTFQVLISILLILQVCYILNVLRTITIRSWNYYYYAVGERSSKDFVQR